MDINIDQFSEEKFNILIVDDRQENILALENLLEDQPCKVITALSGQEALEKLLDYEIFLILMDVQMPEMDGFETAELIRGNKKTQNIPIIFITALGKDQEYIFKGYQCGAVDYLLKPISPMILKKKIAIFHELYHQKKLLDEKNAELKRMFYIASHDLRSPLINIQGFSKELLASFSLIKETLEGSNISPDYLKPLEPVLQSEIPEALEYIESSVRKMDQLLNGLLKISRIGQVIPSKKDLNIKEMISDIVEQMQYQIKDKGITVEIGELLPCSGDSILLNQVFSNLINNSVKYSDPAKAGHINVQSQKKSAYIVYSIADNGIGIPDSHTEQVFNLFHRVNPEEKSIEGEGLGLTAVRLIVERHQGKIWLQSTYGVGTTFFVAIPSYD